MKHFLDKNFLLDTKTSQKLYHNFAEFEPIFDFHNHLSSREIYENKTLGNLANAWLDHDHYKWRAMRAYGIEENLITGHLNKDGSVNNLGEEHDYNRFLAFVKTLCAAVGNPLYHWSHLELQRYFGINEPLTLQNAAFVWEKCNQLLQKEEFSPRGLLKMQNVKALCTTDDPLDDLEYHKKLSLEWSEIKVLPSFRPDFLLNAENLEFATYIKRLQDATKISIIKIDDMIEAASDRMDYFKSVGSVVSDHSLECDFYAPFTKDQIDSIFAKAMNGELLSAKEIAQYKAFVLIEFGKLYAKKGFVMQIHIGALRDQNSFMLEKNGKNIGEDSLQDFNYAWQIGNILNAIYSSEEGKSAKVVLYNLNPKDNEALATMAANFRNCVFGPAWWFNDHKDGIEDQIRIFARTSVLENYVGMLTDSRSFLSFPRHEYFRRILCNFIGNLVEKGEYPNNKEYLGKMVKKICYQNSVDFFEIK